MAPDGLVTSLMEPFIDQHGDWKMVELSGLEKRLRKVNFDRWVVQTLYLYGNPAYSTIYKTIGPYKTIYLVLVL